MKWFIKCLKNYVTFRGRARRKEYWYFTLFTLLIMIFAMVADLLIFDKPSLFYGCAALALFLPSLAVWVRRLHDTGRSGKWILWYYLFTIVWVILLVATGASYFMSAMQGVMGMPSISFLIIYLVGILVYLVWSIFFLVWMCSKGTAGDNKYGSDPLAVQE